MSVQLNNHECIKLKNEKLWLLPQKAILWPKKKLLLIADLHLGKTTHFRKKGIAVPKDVPSENWKKLHQLIKLYQPQRVCFLGDLFHSNHNKEWIVFGELIEKYSSIQFELVLGNHDILDPKEYQKIGFKMYLESLVEKPFEFTHEPVENSIYYNLAGHLHPGVKLKGAGKQSLKAPCFYFGKNQGILPAFGSFTGLSIIKVKKDDQVFIITEEQVIPV